MFTVYALHSPKFSKIYIGYTSNLEQRLKSHNELSTKGWSIKFRPWNLILTEQYLTKKEAMQLEKKLKSAKGRAFIWKIVENKKIKIRNILLY